MSKFADAVPCVERIPYLLILKFANLLITDLLIYKKKPTFVLCDKRSNKLPSLLSEFLRTDFLFHRFS